MLELLIKLLIQSFPSQLLYAIAYILYLALEEGSPFIQTDLYTILLFY